MTKRAVKTGKKTALYKIRFFQNPASTIYKLGHGTAVGNAGIKSRKPLIYKEKPEVLRGYGSKLPGHTPGPRFIAKSDFIYKTPFGYKIPASRPKIHITQEESLGTPELIPGRRFYSEEKYGTA